MKEAVAAADEARAAIADKKAALERATKERTEALLQVSNQTFHLCLLQI